MGKKQTPDSTDSPNDCYAEIVVIEEEKPPRPDDSTTKCRTLEADFILPRLGVETKLYFELDLTKGDEAAKSIRNQIMTLFREGGVEGAFDFVQEFREEIDECFGKGKSDKLLELLDTKDNSKH